MKIKIFNLIFFWIFVMLSTEIIYLQQFLYNW